MLTPQSITIMPTTSNSLNISSPSLILIIGHKNYMHPQNSSPSSLFCVLGTYKRTWEKILKYLHIHIVILKNDWDKEVGLGSDDTFDLIEKSKETINQMGFFFNFVMQPKWQSSIKRFSQIWL